MECTREKIEYPIELEGGYEGESYDIPYTLAKNDLTIFRIRLLFSKCRELSTQQIFPDDPPQ